MIRENRFDGDRFICRIAGTVVLEDIVSLTEIVRERHGRQPVLSQIWYYEDVDDIAIDIPELRNLISQTDNGSMGLDKMRVAIVSQGLLAYGVGRQYAALASEAPWETQVFKREADALNWLSI